jgi:hypothetical protein
LLLTTAKTTNTPKDHHITAAQIHMLPLTLDKEQVACIRHALTESREKPIYSVYTLLSHLINPENPYRRVPFPAIPTFPNLPVLASYRTEISRT